LFCTWFVPPFYLNFRFFQTVDLNFNLVISSFFVKPCDGDSSFREAPLEACREMMTFKMVPQAIWMQVILYRVSDRK